MLLVFVFVLAIFFFAACLTGTDAFTTTSSTSIISWSSSLSSEMKSKSKADKQVKQVVGSSRHSATRLQQLVRQRSDTENSSKEEEDCHLPCASLNDSNDDSDDESRREALFSMVGALWAISGTSITIGVVVSSKSLPLNAATGDFAKIELPNPYQTLSDRATKQCLSESQGNRECLVYAEDAESFCTRASTAACCYNA